MASLQHIAERIFRRVNAGHLEDSFALAMGAIIDANDEDPDVRDWIDTVSVSAVERLIACMAHHGKWNDRIWLREYVRKASESGESERAA